MISRRLLRRGSWRGIRNISPDLFHQRIPLKGQFVIVGKVGELLLRHLHLARTGDVIDGTFDEDVIELRALVIEARRSDLSGIIQQVDAEQLALAALVVPVSDLALLRASGFDGPLPRIWGQSLDRKDRMT